MVKLIALDIDGTLTDFNKPIDFEVVELLKQLGKSNVRIALISGKPAIYICGLARQLGLCDSIIVGENGASIFYGHYIPPTSSISVNSNKEKAQLLKDLFVEVEDKFGGQFWVQPKIVNLTFFYKDVDAENKINNFLKTTFENEIYNENFDIYWFPGAVDIVPKGINKGVAIKKILEQENIQPNEAIAVGDDSNDFPMFDVAGTSIGVNLRKKYSVSKEFQSIVSALEYIKTIL